MIELWKFSVEVLLALMEYFIISKSACRGGEMRQHILTGAWEENSKTS